jgi:iron(III) transport system substrate-binding protein
MKRALPFVLLLLAVATAVALALFKSPGDVVLYTAIDEEFARPLLARFQEETGIRVDVVTDTEATKSVGLANALLAEGKPGGRVRADVFWNNEPMWTVRLAGQGVLASWVPPGAADIPAAFKDPNGFWTANGLRARVFIAHTPSLAGGRPTSDMDYVDAAWKDKAALARPLAGTTLSHMAALRQRMGAAPWETWFRALAANGTAFPSGNGSLAREVGRGTRVFGFTDTDDFVVRKVSGDPVELIFPDQAEGKPGTYVLPLTVSLVRGAPHADNARRLVDWLVSPAIEAELSASDYASIPVRATTKPGPNAVSLKDFRAATVDWNEAAPHIDPVLDVVGSLLK